MFRIFDDSKKCCESDLKSNSSNFTIVTQEEYDMLNPPVSSQTYLIKKTGMEDLEPPLPYIIGA